MTKLSDAVMQSGAIDAGMLQELNKWRLPLELPTEEAFDTADEAVAAIEEAMEGAEQVEVRSTDLDVLRRYARTQAKGRLHIVTPNEKGAFPVTYGKGELGEYIIPWQADSLEELLTNGQSFLHTADGDVYFSRIQDLYFGERKVFILCTPIRGDHVK